MPNIAASQASGTTSQSTLPQMFARPISQAIVCVTKDPATRFKQGLILWIISYPSSRKTAVADYITYKSQLHGAVCQQSEEQKDRTEAEQKKSIREDKFSKGDLVMLYQKKTGKLLPRWRVHLWLPDLGAAMEDLICWNSSVDGRSVDRSMWITWRDSYPALGIWPIRKMRSLHYSARISRIRRRRGFYLGKYLRRHRDVDKDTCVGEMLVARARLFPFAVSWERGLHGASILLTVKNSITNRVLTKTSSLNALNVLDGTKWKEGLRKGYGRARHVIPISILPVPLNLSILLYRVQTTNFNSIAGNRHVKDHIKTLHRNSNPL